MNLCKYLCLFLYKSTRRYYTGSLYGSTRRYYLTYTYIIGLIFIRVFRRSYRAYSYSEIPIGITDLNDTHSFPLIYYSGYYHITMGIPRPVLINKEDTTQSISKITIQYGSAVAQSRIARVRNRSAVALIRTGVS